MYCSVLFYSVASSELIYSMPLARWCLPSLDGKGQIFYALRALGVVGGGKGTSLLPSRSHARVVGKISCGFVVHDDMLYCVCMKKALHVDGARPNLTGFACSYQ